MKRIGIMGGNFDPPHLGHLIIAEQARQRLNLDIVLFVPAFISPFKKDKKSTPAKERVKMLQLAIEGNRYFEVELWEVSQEKVSYTVDTLKMLKNKYSSAELFLIIGDDNLAAFDRWHSPGEVLELAQLIVFRREHQRQDFQFTERQIYYLDEFYLGISSTLIRQKVNKKQSIRYLVPEAVDVFIQEKKLYLSL